MQPLCDTSKLKEVPTPNSAISDILFPQTSLAEDIAANAALQVATMGSSVLEPMLTTARHFRLNVDIVLSHGASPRVADAISSILQGAGLHRYSRQAWGMASCGIEEAADSLSDVFLELQAMDDHVKQCIEMLHVSMCSDSRHGGFGLPPYGPTSPHTIPDLRGIWGREAASGAA